MAMIKRLANGIVCDVICKKAHGVDYVIGLQSFREKYHIVDGSFNDALIRCIAHFRALVNEESAYIIFSELQELALKALSTNHRHENDIFDLVRLVADIERELEDGERFEVTIGAPAFNDLDENEED